MSTPINHAALLSQAANITMKWHAENCSTDMCDCIDDAKALLVFAADMKHMDEIVRGDSWSDDFIGKVARVKWRL